MSSIQVVQLNALKPYGKNSRIHSGAQVEQLASSMSEFGFTNPVLVDESMTILAGHGRVLAAIMLGLESAPCIVISGMTELQKQAYVLADNKLAMTSGWNEEVLRSEMENLKAVGFDLDLIGFGKHELAKMLIPQIKTTSDVPEDAGYEHECPSCGHEFNA